MQRSSSHHNASLQPASLLLASNPTIFRNNQTHFVSFLLRLQYEITPLTYYFHKQNESIRLIIKIFASEIARLYPLFLTKAMRAPKQDRYTPINLWSEWQPSPHLLSCSILELEYLNPYAVLRGFHRRDHPKRSRAG